MRSQPAAPPTATIAYSVETRSAVEPCLQGGDVFEAFTRLDGSSSFLLADVSSKGALGFAHAEMLRYAFRDQASCARSPAHIITKLNALRFNDECDRSSVTFATVFVATVVREKPSLSYASAGHDTAIIFAGKRHRHLAATGPMIGIIH